MSYAVKTKLTTEVTPQAMIVLRHIEAAGSITQREALMDHGVQSLTKRISELRSAGADIVVASKRHPLSKQRYARYSLKEV